MHNPYGNIPNKSTDSFFDKIKYSLTNLYNNTIGMFLAKLFSKKRSLLFLGIDNAGKTTLVQKFKLGVNVTSIPTRNPRREEIEIGKLKCYIHDLGGHEAARHAWKSYYYTCDGIVFIVDIVDTDRYETVKDAFADAYELSEGKIPFLVLFNKIDMVSHYNESEILMQTGFDMFSEEKNIHFEFVSVKDMDLNNGDDRIIKGFEWLEMILNKK